MGRFGFMANQGVGGPSRRIEWRGRKNFLASRRRCAAQKIRSGLRPSVCATPNLRKIFCAIKKTGRCGKGRERKENLHKRRVAGNSSAWKMERCCESLRLNRTKRMQSA